MRGEEEDDADYEVPPPGMHPLARVGWQVFLGAFYLPISCAFAASKVSQWFPLPWFPEGIPMRSLLGLLFVWSIFNMRKPRPDDDCESGHESVLCGHHVFACLVTPWLALACCWFVAKVVT